MYLACVSCTRARLLNFSNPLRTAGWLGVHPHPPAVSYGHMQAAHLAAAAAALYGAGETVLAAVDDAELALKQPSTPGARHT
jgi:hypothetical protein